MEDLVARLERERLDADRRYNDALTAIDRALHRSAVALPPPPSPPDRTRLTDANTEWDILPGGAPAFDRSLRGRLGAFVWSLVGGPLQRQHRFNATLVDHLNRAAESQEAAAVALGRLGEILRQEFDALTQFHALLALYLQTITAYIDTRDRSVGGPELREQIVLAQERVLALKRQVEGLARRLDGQDGRVEQDGRDRQDARDRQGGQPNRETPTEAVTYVAFEDRFRGTRDDIRARLRDYLPLLEGASDVLDVGCGRGEFLELMRERGIAARGVDANSEMVELCRERGLVADVSDALTFVAAQPGASLGGLTAIQVVEHFEPAYLSRFLEAVFRALRPGAVMILETINPACWMAFFETYIRDLTHARPLHPETLRFLAQAAGFTRVDISYRAPVQEGDRLPSVALAADSDPAVAQLAAAVNAHAERLNARLFGAMDYAVIARK